MNLPDPVGDRRVTALLVLVEARLIRAVIRVRAPTAAGKATLLADQAAHRTDLQEVCDDMAGELPPPVEGFELFAHSTQFVIAHHSNTPATFNLTLWQSGDQRGLSAAEELIARSTPFVFSAASLPSALSLFRDPLRHVPQRARSVRVAPYCRERIGSSMEAAFLSVTACSGSRDSLGESSEKRV